MLTYLIFSLLGLTWGGMIYPYDSNFVPNNKNTESQITLIFSFDTTISSSDFLRIVFPFRVTGITTAYYDNYTNCNTTSPTKGAVITNPANDNMEFFVRFYTDLTLTVPTGLNSELAYYLTFTGIPDSAAQTGINVPIGLYTVSNAVVNWIYYDSNPVFTTIELANAPPATATILLTTPSGSTTTTFSASYNVSIDFIPSITVNNEARIDISTTNTLFAIESCTTQIGALSGHTLLTSTSSVNLNSYTVRITIGQTIYSGAEYRFYCLVTNPASVVTSGIQLKSWKGWASTILETAYLPTGLSSTTPAGASGSITWNSSASEVQLGWGYVASSSTTLPVFGVYRDYNSVEMWYQSAKTVVQPTSSTNSTVAMQFVVDTIPDAACKILKTSIHHNLPAFGSTPVSCSWTKGYITCLNVGNLVNSTTYFLSFKFNLGYTATITSLTNFGKVTLITQDASQTTVIPTSTATLTYKSIYTNQGLFYSSSTHGNIAWTTTTAPTNLEYIANNEAMTLNLEFKYVSTTFIPMLSGTTINMGIEFFTSYALPTPSGTVSCTMPPLTTQASISDCAVINMPSSYSAIRFRIASFTSAAVGSPVYNYFSGATASHNIQIGNIDFTGSMFSSFQTVDQYVFDFYSHWVQGFTPGASSTAVSTAAGSYPFFFNSLVLTNNGLSGLYVSKSMFWAGSTTSDVSVDGSVYPALIRISGSLTAVEQSLTNRLIVFFNNMVPLNLETPCFGPTGITCVYNTPDFDNTETDYLANYYASSSVVINLTSFSSPFNILIPVSTQSTKTSIGFLIATATVIDTASTSQGIFQTQYTRRFSHTTSTGKTGTTQNLGGPGGASVPKLSIPAGTLMGAVVSAPSFTSYTSYMVSSANSNTGTLTGAMYGYCANYDFTTATGFAFASFATATLDQSCVKVSYTSPKYRICYFCPVKSPSGMTNGGTVTLSKFTMPTYSGVDFYDLAVVFSKNTGDYISGALDEQAGVLTALTATSVSLSFIPGILKKTSRNLEADLSFTPATALPQAISIVLAATNLEVTPSIGQTCTSSTIQTTACTTSGTTSAITIALTSVNSTWPATATSIIFNVDSANTALAADIVVTYTLTVKTLGVGGLLAVNHLATAASQTYTIHAQTNLPFVLSNLQYMFGSMAARSIVNFEVSIPSDIYVQANQNLAFNLGGLAPANQEETPFCYMKDSTNTTQSTEFLSCNVSDLTNMTLRAKQSLSGNYFMYIEYVSIPSSIVPSPIQVILYGFDAVYAVSENSETNALALPVSPTIYTINTADFSFTRHYSDAGSPSEIVITFRPKKAAITMNSFMYIYFPQYYASNLGYRSLDCQINGTDLDVGCWTIANRVLMVEGFPINVEINDILAIKIWGVITPVVPTINPGQIYIAFDNDSNYYSLVEQIHITDSASVDYPPDSFYATTWTQSTDIIRDANTYTMTFETDSIGIKSGRVFSIDFPDMYGPVLRNAQLSPTFTLSQIGQINTWTIAATTIGSRFKFTVPTNLEPFTNWELTLGPIPNPDNATCNMDRVLVIISNSSELSSLAKSACNVWDMPRLSYIADPSLSNLWWGNSTSGPIFSLTLTIGIYSPLITVNSPVSTNYLSTCTFETSRSDMSLWATNPEGVAGFPSASFRISAQNSTFPNLVYFGLPHNESTSINLYAPLLKLPIYLTNKPVMIPVSSITICQGGTSLPYSWNFNSLNIIPNNEITIDIILNNAETSALSMLGGSSVTFTPNITYGQFIFVLASSASITNPPSFNISISGTNARNYELQQSTVNITVVAPPTSAPMIYSLSVISNYEPTQQTFVFNMSQMSAIFYYFAYHGNLETMSCTTIISRYSQGNLYNSLNAFQQQWGVFYIYNPLLYSTQTASNLLSNTQYDYVLCPLNQLEMIGSEINGTFSTSNNGASIYLVTVNFNAPINRACVQSIACQLQIEWGLNNLNVVSRDGTTCNVESYFDDFSTYNYENVEFYVYGDRRTNIISSLGTSVTDDINSLGVPAASQFKAKFTQAIKSNGFLSNYLNTNQTTASSFATPVFVTTNVEVTATYDSLTLTNLALSTGWGYFYAIADQGVETFPNYEEIRSKTNSSSYTVSGANVRYMGTPVDLTITGLSPSASYYIYYYASNEDLSQYGRVTAVYVKTATTSAQPVVKSGSLVNVLSSGIIALICILLI